MADVDFNFFLRQKYAQLQQQADATTQNASTNAMVGRAAAGFDAARTALMPAESKANVGLTRAQTGLTNEQAAIVAPESAARISNMNADTNRTNIGARVDERQGLMGIGSLPGVQAIRDSLLGGIGGASSTRFNTSQIIPGRDPRRVQRGLGLNPSAADLDYANESFR